MGINLAILGATGSVGLEMIKIIEERKIPVDKISFLASENSYKKKVRFSDQEYNVNIAEQFDFKGTDIVLGAVKSNVSEHFSQRIVDSGAIFIDNSSRFRLCNNVPLVVPEINGDDIRKHNGIISNPNCSTIIALMAANAINTLSPIKRIIASTYQAVSGAGIGGINELSSQQKAMVEGSNIENKVFSKQIVENLIPQIGVFSTNGYTDEEMKMQNEGKRILHSPNLLVSCTCVRVPIMRSHSISMSVYTENKISVTAAKNAISKQKGCILWDDTEKMIYPTPLESSSKDEIYVGRIREDLTSPNGLTLFCCGDQIRKGAALNAIQIMEILIK